MPIIETRRAEQEKSCLQYPANNGHDIPLVNALFRLVCVPTSRTVVLESWASVGSVGVRRTAGRGWVASGRQPVGPRSAVGNLTPAAVLQCDGMPAGA
ncbi:hypothetical protein CGRA01v4_03714 [Colletotrichum graminicola]|nr:hypothetical protein CGRA01v4_03714 [Colletotrichum graminicola]